MISHRHNSDYKAWILLSVLAAGSVGILAGSQGVQGSSVSVGSATVGSTGATVGSTGAGRSTGAGGSIGVAEPKAADGSTKEREEPSDAPFPWHRLRQVEWKEVETDDGSLYGFDYKLVVDDAILALEGSRLVMEGYLTPLTEGDTHSEFLFTMSPHSGCSNCSEMSLTNTLIASARDPLPFTDARVSIEGILRVVPEDGQGVLYRMADMVLLKEHPDTGAGDGNRADDSKHSNDDGHKH